MPVVSAGVLPYRIEPFEVLVAHPGGPFWARRDHGAWSVIKGIVETGENELETVRREFTEETGWEFPDAALMDLGTTTLRSGKVVHAWAVHAPTLDPATLHPGTFTMEWPRESGRSGEYPEIDRVQWFEPETARRKLNPAQAVFVDRLRDALFR